VSWRVVDKEYIYTKKMMMMITNECERMWVALKNVLFFWGKAKS
jgi:hypothetical protein